MQPLGQHQIEVSIFCGGRGSASILREFVRWPHVNLNLLINAYDDGLSTGKLRDFIPGMLGPSDFRKNLSHLVDLYSSQQYALQRILEYRLPLDASEGHIDGLVRYATDPCDKSGIPEPLREQFAQLDAKLEKRLRGLLGRFFEYYRATGRTLVFADCSLGNLLFAGAYMSCSQNFNAATRLLTELVGSRATLINVSLGENRTLVALKKDGGLLRCEAEIVAPQSSTPILDIFFLVRPLMTEEQHALEGLSVEEKRHSLRMRELKVSLSPEANYALLRSDIIIYGPGTQFSSLLPSYRTGGLDAALRASCARVKAFIVNLETDHDIQSLGAADLVDKALEMLGDPDNKGHHITHILYNRNSAMTANGIRLAPSIQANGGIYKDARVIEDEFENPINPRIHSGYAVVHKVLDLFERQPRTTEKETLDVYVDVIDRSLGLDALLQEFLELRWDDCFGKVRLRVNRLPPIALTLPPHLEVERTEYGSLFSEVAVLIDWLIKGDSACLVTLTGDGEYRLRDVLTGLHVLRAGSFGVVYGSRNQARRQFRTSLAAAYGEGTLLFGLSWLGAFMLTVLFGLRFHVIFSDPLTGFRIYMRSRLNESFCRAVLAKRPGAAAAVTTLLLAHRIEIAEIPVSYRTFTGFTKASWRLWRGMKNLLGLFV